jgi:hypothetical protein
MITSLLTISTASLFRRRYGVRLDPKSRVPLAARALAWIACLLFVVLAGGFALVMKNPTEIVHGIPSGLKALLVLPVLATALTLGEIVYTVIIWRSRRGRT